MIRVLLALGLVLALPYLRAPLYEFPPPRPFAGAEFYDPYAGLVGTWQRANLHAHGVTWRGIASGRQASGDVVRRYRRLGYAVPGISNYQQITTFGQESALALYEHGFNVGKRHQIAIGARRVSWFDLPLWQSVSHKQFVIDRVAQTTALVAIAHPTARFPYTADDFRRLTGYHLIEVANGQVVTEAGWDAALSSGRAVWAIGSDDTHDVTDPRRTAVAWTMIDAASASPSEIVAALGAGRSYTVARRNDGSTNIETHLARVRFRDGVLDVGVAGDPSTFLFIGQNGTLRRAVGGVTEASYSFASDDTYIRTVIRSPRTWMLLNPIVRAERASAPAPRARVDGLLTWMWRALLIAGAALAVRIGLGRAWRRSALMVFVAAGAADAQPFGPPDSAPPLVSTYDRALLADLPLDNVYALLETLQPSVVADRFSSGGLWAGQPTRVGGFLSSWTQTTFRVDGQDVTDPYGTGTPLLLPTLVPWQRVSVRTGMMPADTGATGLEVAFEPMRPTDTWERQVSVTSAHGVLTPARSVAATAAGHTAPPPIARLEGWDHMAALAAGPLTERVGGVFAVSWMRGSQFARSQPEPVSAALGSAFAHVVAAPSDRTEVRTLGWIDRSEHRFEHRAAFRRSGATTALTTGHLQGVWEQQASEMLRWRASGAYSRSASAPRGTAGEPAVFERLVDGPVSAVGDVAERSVQRWFTGFLVRHRRSSAAEGGHAVEAGVDLTGQQATSASFFEGAVGERTHGVPSRLWRFESPHTASVRKSLAFAAYASDRLSLGPSLSVTAGLRFDLVHGSADGAAAGITWRSWLPRASLRWSLAQDGTTAVTGGYARSAYRLPLNLLAVGDPAAPVADVFRWSATAGVQPHLPEAFGPLVLRAGPGTGGDAAFTRIDADLARPTSDELVVHFETRPLDRLAIRAYGVARWEHGLPSLLNLGAPPSAYTSFTVDDPGADVGSAHDDRTILVFDRRPETFGLDRYLLTSAGRPAATGQGFEVTAEWTSDAFVLRLGATASTTGGDAAHRGFGPTENDQATAGELFSTPNAATLARGRLFADRAFTGKVGVVYRLPRGFRLGALARYQDGQPFARVLVFPDLNQGAEAVRAFANGESRFTFTGTLDLRLQKVFVLGGARVAAVLDVYNALDLVYSVEEDVAAPPNVRISTASQPPRAFHVGGRVEF